MTFNQQRLTRSLQAYTKFCNEPTIGPSELQLLLMATQGLPTSMTAGIVSKAVAAGGQQHGLVGLTGLKYHAELHSFRIDEAGGAQNPNADVFEKMCLATPESVASFFRGEAGEEFQLVVGAKVLRRFFGAIDPEGKTHTLNREDGVHIPRGTFFLLFHSVVLKNEELIPFAHHCLNSMIKHGMLKANSQSPSGGDPENGSMLAELTVKLEEGDENNRLTVDPLAHMAAFTSRRILPVPAIAPFHEVASVFRGLLHRVSRHLFRVDGEMPVLFSKQEIHALLKQSHPSLFIEAKRNTFLEKLLKTSTQRGAAFSITSSFSLHQFQVTDNSLKSGLPPMKKDFNSSELISKVMRLMRRKFIFCRVGEQVAHRLEGISLGSDLGSGVTMSPTFYMPKKLTNKYKIEPEELFDLYHPMHMIHRKYYEEVSPALSAIVQGKISASPKCWEDPQVRSYVEYCLVRYLANSKGGSMRDVWDIAFDNNPVLPTSGNSDSRKSGMGFLASSDKLMVFKDKSVPDELIAKVLGIPGLVGERSAPRIDDDDGHNDRTCRGKRGREGEP